MVKLKKDAASLSVIVGRNMQVCRKRKKMTQNQLAQELGVEVETVSRYERGLVAPSFPQLEKICTVLDVAAWTLFSDGKDIPDMRDIVISESLDGLSTKDRDFIRSFVQAYAEHHQNGKRKS